MNAKLSPEQLRVLQVMKQSPSKAFTLSELGATARVMIALHRRSYVFETFIGNQTNFWRITRKGYELPELNTVQP